MCVSIPLKKPELLICMKLSTDVFVGLWPWLRSSSRTELPLSWYFLCTQQTASLHKLIRMQIKAVLKTPFYSGNVKGLKGRLNYFNSKNSEYSGPEIVTASVSVNYRILFCGFAWFLTYYFETVFY